MEFVVRKLLKKFHEMRRRQIKAKWERYIARGGHAYIILPYKAKDPPSISEQDVLRGINKYP